MATSISVGEFQSMGVRIQMTVVENLHQVIIRLAIDRNVEMLVGLITTGSADKSG